MNNKTVYMSKMVFRKATFIDVFAIFVFDKVPLRIIGLSEKFSLGQGTNAGWLITLTMWDLICITFVTPFFITAMFLLLLLLPRLDLTKIRLYPSQVQFAGHICLSSHFNIIKNVAFTTCTFSPFPP